jgi:predicted nucleic acid-binding protein
LIAIVDSGPLYAAVDADDNDHARSLDVLQRADLDLVIPALVVAEVTYLVGKRLGPKIEAEFLRGLTGFEVEGPSPEDWQEIAALVERYRDFALGGTNASVAVLAERLRSGVILTLDRRHFSVIRRRDGGSYQLLPE